MNPAPESEDWLDAVQSRRLTPEALERLRRQLATRPRELSRLDDELALNRMLDAPPIPPVSSNFLSRVEARIEAEERAARTSAWFSWNRLGGLRWLRPLAFAAVALVAAGAWWQVRIQQRASLATSITAVSRAASMPGVESLRDFDAVQLLLTTAQPGDVELLAALDMDPSDAAARTP